MTGAQLQRARKRLGMSVEELAATCFVSRKTIWQWSRDGVDGLAAAYIELLIQQHQNVYRRVGMTKLDYGKARQTRGGGGYSVDHNEGRKPNLEDQVFAIIHPVRKRGRPAHADEVRKAEQAFADFIRHGGEVVVLPTKSANQKARRNRYKARPPRRARVAGEPPQRQTDGPLPWED